MTRQEDKQILNPSSFTVEDRAMLQNSCAKIDSIFSFIFGSPENSNNSLIMQVDRNTRFRQFASKLLFAIVPTILMIIFYLFKETRR